MAKKFDLAELMGARASEKMSESDTIVNLPVEEIHDNAGNFYVVDDVKDLCDSIAVSGVLQPILARPRAEGGYTLVAGHRRTKAVRQLRDEWKGKGANPYDTIPAILRPAPATKAEELLEDLALITTNSAARKLTDPELSRQAEKLTDILYGLKQEGYEFPGRMRKVVADALGVSETKIARQKVIREGLSPAWRARWEAGTCPEYAAEALAKLAPEVQDAMLFMKQPDPSRIGYLADYYRKCHTVHHCPYNGEKPCDRAETFWAVGSRETYSYDRCGGYSSIQCCADCRKALKCKSCCPVALEKVKAREKREKQQREKDKLAEQKKAEAKKARAAALWARFKDLRETAGISRAELSKKLHLQNIYCETEETFGMFEENDFEHMYPWQVGQTPEEFLSFKGVYLCAQLFGCPLAALTDEKWTPTEDIAGPAEALDRDSAARALPQSPAGDSSLPEGAGTVEEAAGTGEDLSAPAGAPPLAGEANAGQWPAWISVEDALPPEGVTVLTVGVDGDLSDDHLVSSDNWAYSAKGEITHWMPSPPEPGADRTLPPSLPSPWGRCPEGADEGLYWRPFPKVKPAAGQRALVVQEQADYDRLIFEAKLARYAAEENRWYWVSELIPDVEAERVTKWLPEPGDLPEEPEEDDDAEYPEE